MRQSVQLTLAAMLLLSPLFAKDKSFPEVSRVVPMTELDAVFIKEVASGAHPDIAIECKEGTTLPIGFLHNWGLFSLKCMPNLTITVEMPCYLRCVGKKAYMSQDLISWEKADRFFSGKCDADVKIDETGVLVETRLVPRSQGDADEFGY